MGTAALSFDALALADTIHTPHFSLLTLGCCHYCYFPVADPIILAMDYWVVRTIVRPGTRSDSRNWTKSLDPTDCTDDSVVNTYT
jgi:hypothetical protein